jgi:hypothetical protein
VDRLFALWEQGSLITGALAVVITLGVVGLLIFGRPVPNELWLGFASTLGFFYGANRRRAAAVMVRRASPRAKPKKVSRKRKPKRKKRK